MRRFGIILHISFFEIIGQNFKGILIETLFQKTCENLTPKKHEIPSRIYLLFPVTFSSWIFLMIFIEQFIFFMVGFHVAWLSYWALTFQKANSRHGTPWIFFEQSLTFSIFLVGFWVSVFFLCAPRGAPHHFRSI